MPFPHLGNAGPVCGLTSHWTDERAVEWISKTYKCWFHQNLSHSLYSKTFRAFNIIRWIARLICSYTSYIHVPENGFAFSHITNIWKKMKVDSSCAFPIPGDRAVCWLVSWTSLHPSVTVQNSHMLIKPNLHLNRFSVGQWLWWAGERWVFRMEAFDAPGATSLEVLIHAPPTQPFMPHPPSSVGQILCDRIKYWQMLLVFANDMFEVALCCFFFLNGWIHDLGNCDTIGLWLNNGYANEWCLDFTLMWKQCTPGKTSLHILNFAFFWVSDTWRGVALPYWSAAASKL